MVYSMAVKLALKVVFELNTVCKVTGSEPFNQCSKVDPSLLVLGRVDNRPPPFKVTKSTGVPPAVSNATTTRLGAANGPDKVMINAVIDKANAKKEMPKPILQRLDCLFVSI